MTDGRSLRGLFEALLVMLIVGLLVFHLTDAATNFSLTKPLIRDFVAVANPLKPEIVDLLGGYNVDTARYDNVTVAIRNVGLDKASGTVSIQLFNATNTLIAQGEKAVPSIASQTTLYINVPLTWEGNATVIDYARDRVTIY